MYKTTILTSLYKGSQYLESFLDNILAQTVFDQCQLYIINGNSPEYKEEELIIEAYKQYNNIKYVRLQEDTGIYKCWNMAIKDSQSQYITNANVDDKIFPTCIEEHTKLLDEEPNVDVAYCVNIEVDSFDLENPHIKQHVYPTADFSRELMLQGNLPHNHPVWRRSLHDKFGYFEENKYVSGSDWDFWLRCAFGGSEMKLINKALGIYYRNPTGVSSDKKNMERNLSEIMQIHKHYAERLRNERLHNI